MKKKLVRFALALVAVAATRAGMSIPSAEACITWTVCCPGAGYCVTCCKPCYVTCPAPLE